MSQLLHVCRSWRRCLWFSFTTIKHLIQRRKSCLSTFQSHERSPPSTAFVVLPIAKDDLHPWRGRYFWKYFVSNSHQEGCHSVVSICWWLAHSFTRSSRRRKPLKKLMEIWKMKITGVSIVRRKAHCNFSVAPFTGHRTVNHLCTLA